VSVEARQLKEFAMVPQPEFEVVAAGHVAFAAAPTMVFSVRAQEHGVLEIQSMSLSVQVMIDPARRGYDEDTREQLAELFGRPATWAPSTQGLSWARVSAAVPAFQGETMFALEVPCSYDLEVAASKYFYSLSDGVVPLSFHFYGTVFYCAPDGRLQMTPVPWSASATFAMPVSAWQAMIAEHYPGGGWIRLSGRTLSALNALRAERGLTFDDTVQELLDRD
jgi:Family of unknown function (DUF6084)